MAFRAYELNLIMRVQDRGSSRLRRIARDLGGVNRAAQMQRDAARLANNARSASARIEQRAAADRLRGLNQSNAAVKVFNSELAIAVQRQRLSRVEAERIAAQYARIVALQRSAGRATAATHAGAVSTFAGGISLAALGGAAGTFAGFNRETVKAATQMRGVDESFESTIRVAGILQTGILDLTRTFPAGANEMAQSAFQIASGMDFVGNSVQRYNQTFKLLRATNKVAVAGFTDLESATDAVITIFNNFDPEIKNLNGNLNTLFAIVRFGRGDFTQFSELFGGVAAVAKGAGQNLTEAGSALAFLTTRLPRPEAAASYRRLIQVLGQRTFVAGFKEIFGEPITVNVDGVEKLRPLSEIINTIVTKAPQLTKGGVQLQNLIQSITSTGQLVLTGRRGQGLQGTEQARRGLTNLITGWQQYRNILANVSADVDEFDRSFEAASNTPGVRWQVAINQFKAFAIIVGQDVLPVIIRFIDRISQLAHWFEDLSPSTRRLVGQFAAWGSIVALIGGILATLLGSIARLIIGYKLLKVGTDAAGKSSFGLLGALRALALIGAITVAIKVLRQGDADAWDFLLGAFAGAALGSKFGLPGAVAGAITVPIILKVIEDQGPKVTDMNKAVEAISGKIDAGDRIRLPKGIYTEIAREAFNRGVITKQEFLRGMELANFGPEAINFQAARFIPDPNLQHLVEKHKVAAKSVLDTWRELSASLTGLDVFGRLNQDAATKAVQIQVNLARATASGDISAIRRALNASLAFDQAQIKRLEGMAQTAQTQKQLIQLYEDEADIKQKLKALTKDQVKIESGLANQKVQAALQAREDKINKINTAADKLVEKYKELEAANRAAFGIFEGPISQGPIAGIFNQINETLQGFGAKPIAIPITLQTQDISAQVRNFDLFRKGLDTLRRRGAPPELIAELQSKGIDALPLIQGLNKAAPGAFRTYVNLWKRSQKLIAESTEKDMAATLKLWRSYGGDIAWQIVQGLASDKAQVTLREGYSKWIVSTFGSVLEKEMNAQIQKAVAAFVEKTDAKAKATKSVTPVRSTQGVTPRAAGNTTTIQGDTNTIHADGATPSAVKRAIDQVSFDKRRRGGR